MTESEIIGHIRRGIREPVPDTVSDSQISLMIKRAVSYIGGSIKTIDPVFFLTRKSVSSTTHIFTLPTDCETLLNVYSLAGVAGTITGATNATPIVITETSHPRVTTDVVFIHDVVGNTAANGSWVITKVDANTYSLNGSVGNGAYTSGGKVFKEPTDLNSTRMYKILPGQSTQATEDLWYLRGRSIVVDDPTFVPDLVLDYYKIPTVLTDIPTEYQEGIIAYSVVALLELPNADDKKYSDFKNSLDVHTSIFKAIMEQIGNRLKGAVGIFNSTDSLSDHAV